MAFMGTAVILCVFVMWPTCQGYPCTGGREIHVEEGQQLSLTCALSYDGTTRVKWWLYNDGRHSIGSCSPLDGRSCNTSRPEYQLNTNQSWTELVVKGNLRATIAGTVECERGVGPTLNLQSKENCHIRVMYPADKVTNCHFHWDLSQDWTVSGACDVEKIPPDDQHQYICRWKHKAWKTDAMPINSSKGECRFRGLHLNKDSITGSDLKLFIDPGDGWMLAKSFPMSPPYPENVDDDADDSPSPVVIVGTVGAVIVPLIFVVVIVVVIVAVKKRRGRHHVNGTYPHQGRVSVVPDRQQKVRYPAASGDDYNTLSFYIGTARQSGRDLEAQYSHIGTARQ